jgi:hypothetical protein
MRLRVEGYFKDGLKTGTWKSWRESGELLGIVKWKRGERQGRALFYDNAGNIQKSVKYKNDLMDGNTFVYHRGGAKEKIRYRKGIELKKEKSSGRIKNPENNISTGETNPTKKDNFFRKLSKKITKPFKKKGNKSNKDLKESPGGTDSKKKVDSKIDSK